MVTIYDVAKELNLNPSTVSRAFKNPEMLSEKTRKRVIETAKRLGYHPNMVASQLRTNSSNVIGIVTVGRKRLWNWYSDTFISGAQSEATEHGYKVMAMDSNFDNYKSDVELFSLMRFAGTVVASTEILDLDCEFSSIVPIVFVNQRHCNGFNILPDDYQDLRVELDYLKALGHTKIAYINGREDSPHANERLRAYRDMMRENGFDIKPEWIGKSGDWSSEVAYEETLRILSCDDRPTAIVAAGDSMCPGIYDAIRDLGLHVPADVSVVGYDNQELSELLTPKLTTISFPLYEMGRAAVSRLIELIEDGADSKGLENPSYVRGELIIRDSVQAL